MKIVGQQTVVDRVMLNVFWLSAIVFIFGLVKNCDGFTSSSTSRKNGAKLSQQRRGLSSSMSSSLPPRTRTKLAMKKRRRTKKLGESSQSKPCSVCPEYDDESSITSSLDRREWVFATIGSLWSMGFVPQSILPKQLQGTTMTPVAHALYGADAKIEMPNVMEGLSNRVNKQCLSESLGTRECLVYQSDNPLYDGTEAQGKWLQSLEQAVNALQTIPELTESKKWSAVLGVTTGPMGGLSRAMEELAATNPEAKKCAQQVKTDLYEMAAGVERKNGAGILEAHSKATKHLQHFLEIL